MSDTTADIGLRVQIDFDHHDYRDVRDGFKLAGELISLESGAGQRDLFVPAGRDVAPLEVSVAPGRYVCEVTLPSGVVASAEIDAVEGKEDQLLEIDVFDSPYESHSWQYVIGTVAPETTYFTTRSTQTYAEPIVEWSGAEWEQLPWAGGQPQAAGWTPDWQRVTPIYEGEGTFLYRFHDGGPIGADTRFRGLRRFCRVQTGGRAFLVTIPTPWFDRGSSEEVPVEMMVDVGAPEDRSGISVTVRDPALGSGLAYLAAGSLDLAAKMFDESSQDLLFTKMSNPLPATAGAYVLVGTDRGYGDAPWHQWISNLASWQGWMPDAKILLATHRLNMAETDDELDSAKTDLIDAAAAGAPIFTLGLRWLADGLSLFSEDDAAAAALEKVRRFSWSVDMMQPFVVADRDASPTP